MNAFLDAVGRTPLSQTLQTVAWLIPMIQSVHILALAVVFTSAAWLDLRLLGAVAADQPAQRVAGRFLPPVAWGVLVLLLTGLLLMIAEPTRALLNPFFQLKMAALALVGGLTFVIAASVRRSGAGAPDKILAAVSLVLWLAIIALGRWIAYGP